jgi:hypothetical protein
LFEKKVSNKLKVEINKQLNIKYGIYLNKNNLKMKKVYLVFILLWSVLFFWCSLKSSNINETWNISISDQSEDIENNTLVYENKSENFLFSFPKERTFEENQYWFNTIVFTPEDDEIKENIWIAVQKLQKFLSIQKYYEETLTELKDTVVWFKEIKAEDVSIDWLDGKKIIYEHQTNGKNLKSQQTFMISKDNIVYSIVYTATKESFNKFLEWANIILNSFKLKE